ncbi:MULTISPECIES: hypothetical protein [Streptomyces]|uniref:Uncharacterized protein n=1 Tax=Streptomyces acidiscabies TaxID=42234 RepID=A0AAP6EKV3_9ACTN|nr:MULTISPECIES: hypothetical protein [Streptomyces]MBZ3918148.1 hypothetical protein [Streptomyces acidiscabies]MDX2966454.1 hypothetical protein [Streptomyces acidiscabies]MDX3796400.1 hypothetical protein [Streptomyces acidiscabies]
MESWERAAPGVEQHAERAAESACHLADLTGPGAWSTTAAEDALDAIDTLTEALGSADPELTQVLAAVAAATNDARRLLGIAVEDQEPQPPAAAAFMPAARRPPRRRGLGPGFQGIRTAP